MIRSLKHRALSPRLGEISSNELRTLIRNKQASWSWGRLAIDAHSIWWKMKLKPCTCGASGHLMITNVYLATSPNQALFACLCPTCDRITRPSSCGQMLYKNISPYRAAINAIKYWNEDNEYIRKNPASIPLQNQFRYEWAAVVF